MYSARVGAAMLESHPFAGESVIPGVCVEGRGLAGVEDGASGAVPGLG